MPVFMTHTLLRLALAAAFTLALPAADRHVIVVSLDGLTGSTLRNVASLKRNTPNLIDMTTRGAVSEGLTGVYPTVTYPSHTTLVTGRSPSAHGILGNTLFDPERQLNGAWYWYSELIAVPTLWHAARDKGLKTAAVYWPVTVGAAIDFNIPEFRSPRTLEDRLLFRAAATPGLAAEFEKKYGQLPIGPFPDKTRAQMAAHIIETRKPELLLLHLIDYDHEEHSYGPDAPEALPTLEAIDSAIGLLRAAVKQAGIEDKTTFLLVSDHGFRPISKVLQPNAVLTSLGLGAPANDASKWRIGVHSNGGSFALIARDPNDREAIALATRVFEGLLEDGKWGIERVLHRSDLNAIGAYSGAFLSVSMASGYSAGSALTTGPWITPSGATKGTHGYLPGPPEMDASFAAYGPGIQPTRLARARLVDVAPTIAALLGLELPNLEGRNLLQ